MPSPWFYFHFHVSRPEVLRWDHVFVPQQFSCITSILAYLSSSLLTSSSKAQSFPVTTFWRQRLSLFAMLTFHILLAVASPAGFSRLCVLVRQHSSVSLGLRAERMTIHFIIFDLLRWFLPSNVPAGLGCSTGLALILFKAKAAATFLASCSEEYLS